MALYKATPHGNVEMTQEEESALLAEWATNESAVIVPQVVTMRQARLALSQAGLLASVNNAVALTSEAVQLTWEYAQEVRRDDPYVIDLAVTLNLTQEQVDQLFITASTL